jgi:hypothetical protein
LKKTKKLNAKGEELPVPRIKYPKELIWSQLENEKTYYYYRSTAFNFTPPGDGTFQPGQIWDINIKNFGLKFPTTIMDLGVLDECIYDICNETTQYREPCYFIDKLNPSSFQSSSDLLGMLIRRKIRIQPFSQFQWSGLNKWFGGGADPEATYNRNDGNSRLQASYGTEEWTSRAIDGDISQLIATNNMVNVSLFNNNKGDIYYGNFNNPYYSDYLDPNSNEVITFLSSPIPLLNKDSELLTCVLGGAFGTPHTQVVPYYEWRVTGVGFGIYNNDYDFPTNSQYPTIAYQQGLAYPAPTDEIVNWVSPSYFDASDQPPPPQGFYAFNDSGIEISTSGNYRLGTGLYFYFGLRQGLSSYDRFINQFLPPTGDE